MAPTAADQSSKVLVTYKDVGSVRASAARTKLPAAATAAKACMFWNPSTANCPEKRNSNS